MQATLQDHADIVRLSCPLWLRYQCRQRYLHIRPLTPPASNCLSNRYMPAERPAIPIWLRCLPSNLSPERWTMRETTGSQVHLKKISAKKATIVGRLGKARRLCLPSVSIQGHLFRKRRSHQVLLIQSWKKWPRIDRVVLRDRQPCLPSASIRAVKNNRRRRARPSPVLLPKHLVQRDQWDTVEVVASLLAQPRDPNRPAHHLLLSKRRRIALPLP